MVAAIGDALSLGRPYHLEYRILAVDGRVRWVADHGRGVSDEQGALRWIDGVMLDISARHAMEEALRTAKARAEQAAAARTRFLANMSHEIRTPLNAIIGLTETLLDTALAPAQQRQLATVLQAARALLQLLNAVIDTARLDRGAITLALESFSLRALCARVIAAQQPAAERKGLALALDFPPQLDEFYRGDSLRIEQLLLSLLDNAVKFTETGKVVLRVGSSAEGLLFSVEDSGIGMSAAQLESIFEPFTQVDASSTRRFGGTGLGTTLARQLVELMGGRIEVASTPAVGTVFRVCLPLPPVPAPALAVGSVAPLAARAGGGGSVPPDERTLAAAQAALRAAAHCLRGAELPEAALAELESLLGATRLSEITGAVDNFDFERALAGLQALAEELGLPAQAQGEQRC